MTSLLKALVVEDNEAFLRFICSTLQETSQFQVMEAFDGLEAVQMAEEDQPDLVLLDIGLTELSSIEADRRIRRLAPQAKLLFVSSESAPDVVRETFRLGGRAYVDKARCDCDLNEEGAQVPFDNLLDRVTGSDPSVTDYILESPAKCHGARHDLLERPESNQYRRIE